VETVTRGDVGLDHASGGLRPKKQLLRALAGERTERPPIWLMRQAGRYLPEYHHVREAAGGMVGLCNSPEHAVEVTLQPIRRFPLDAAILFADLPQIAAALGQTLEYQVDDGPVLTPPIRSTSDITAFLSASGLHQALVPIYETVRQLTRILPDDVALIGYAGAPWTVATYMVEGRGGASSEHAVIKQWALSDPDSFQPLIDLLTTAIIEFLDRQIEAGAEAIQLFESWAGILPDPLFQRWCIRPVAAIVTALKAKHPSVPIIAFPRRCRARVRRLRAGHRRGLCRPRLNGAAGMGGTEGATRVGPLRAGQPRPSAPRHGRPGTPRRTGRILRALVGGPFVFNLGHGIVKTTPPEHVAALARQVRSWTAPATQ
jgi:uroporphyrinogen decarboxylase